MIRVFLVEDDESILLGLKATLEVFGYQITTCSDGNLALDMIIENKPDLVLLDIVLPGKSGLDICRDLRESGYSAPIIMLTSKRDEIDKVLGLELGADDYITKPFGIYELHARIKALLRRTAPLETTAAADIITFGNIEIDFKKYKCLKDSAPVELSRKEYQILKFFLDNEGEVISRDMLLDRVWGYEAFPTTRTVDNYILSLRKNIEEDHSQPKHILTVHGVGYRFVR